ncbi:DNA polymerase III subunit gamma/tau [Candidatus Babela massiliensis]|uniref:DNA polymerase III subunit gamma/tau n=1 Tax=Candidatus Babela massiliensis TaxID=673862 RepID=V6DHA6_9BACT|nr:DNA polymerase III subunit gamma/tau [Candidatus Babela massiliensis]CDK30328.1 DNA polymerase III gamma/tau subunit [Candidatus Babela massiliensis]
MNIQLNLARKWRSKRFDDVVGQELVIRLIKNSLYRNLVFPVYLLSGPKGSGKTTTARLFASALNCNELSNFEKKPQEVSLPCNQCNSCISMSKFAHPDFIEIDAASNTGVENIRQIIETASFMPVLGKKKIYLIDEAHMLSKAAFNAFLKILEEPPTGTVFMLATTDVNKIISTVQSRCFQLFFSIIQDQDIVNHLSFICTEENISFDIEALNLIANQSQGSLRDAINLLEKVRLNSEKVDKESILETLGFLNENNLFEILNTVLNKNIVELINLFNKINLKNYNVIIIWKQFIELVHQLFLIKNQIDTSIKLNKNIDLIINKISIKILLDMLEIAHSYEFKLSKTTLPYLNLELMFINLAQKINLDKNNNLDKEKFTQVININNNTDNKLDINQDKWKKVLVEIDSLKDPLLNSIFQQAELDLSNYLNKELILLFSKDFVFFKDILEETKKTWITIFNKNFGIDVSIKFNFNKIINNTSITLNNKNNNQNEEIAEKKSIYPKKETILIKNSIINNKKEYKTKSLDISNQSKWPRANTILKIFPGKIYLEENTSL